MTLRIPITLSKRPVAVGPFPLTLAPIDPRPSLQPVENIRPASPALSSVASVPSSPKMALSGSNDGSPAPAATPAPRKLRVLCVDDSSVALKVRAR